MNQQQMESILKQLSKEQVYEVLKNVAKMHDVSLNKLLETFNFKDDDV